MLYEGSLQEQSREATSCFRQWCFRERNCGSCPLEADLLLARFTPGIYTGIKHASISWGCLTSHTAPLGPSLVIPRCRVYTRSLPHNPEVHSKVVDSSGRWTRSIPVIVSPVDSIDPGHCIVGGLDRSRSLYRRWTRSIPAIVSPASWNE
jgi:hypothetical protein